MITFDYVGYLYITKIYGEQLFIDKINPHEYNKVVGFCKNPLVGINK